MSIIEHPILGKKIAYNSLNAKQQEAFNLQQVSAIFAEYGYLVIKLSDDWNGADFIALEFNSEHYIKVQLKGRFSFNKKYLNKNIHICFHDKDTNNWYLYPHDMLCDIMMKKSKTTKSWKEEGAYSFPVISEDNRDILEKYSLNSSEYKNNNSDNITTLVNNKSKGIKQFVVHEKKSNNTSVISKPQAMLIINKKRRG